MKLLLDTHAFVWWSMDRAKLSTHALRMCLDRRNALVLSVVSIWELQIKLQLGKLRFSRPLKRLITIEQEKNQVAILPVTVNHIWILGQLPLHHRDPFDRLLVAQAKSEKATLVTTDSHIMVIAPQVRAVSLDAPLNTDEAENWYRYRDVFGVEWPIQDAAIYGSPETNPAGYAMISPIYYLDRVAMPVQIHHGSADSVIPPAWSRDLFQRLQDLGKIVTYFDYPGAEHTLVGDDYALFLQRNLGFFDRYVRGSSN